MGFSLLATVVLTGAALQRQYRQLGNLLSGDFNMRSFAALTVVAGLLLCGWAVAEEAAVPAKTTMPATRRDNVQETLYGVTVTDPYRWLENQESPETRTWIEQQNTYSRGLLGARPGRERLEKRLAEIRRVEVVGAPIERGGRFFYFKRLPQQEQAVFYLKQGENGKEEVLLDPEKIRADHTASFDLMTVSNDGKLVVYGVRLGGKDETEVHVFDVDARRDRPDLLPEQVMQGAALLPDNSGFYYGVLVKDGPRVRFHKMGTAASQDLEIYGAGLAKENGLSPDVSDDGRYLVITLYRGSAATTTEIYIQDLKKKGPLRPLVKGIEAQFLPSVARDGLFMQTNWKAPKGRVLAVDFAHPEQEHWREVVPESDSAIEFIALAGGKLLVGYLRNATSEVKLFEADGKPAGELTFPAPGSVGGVQSKWDQRTVYAGYTSFTIPFTIYRYDVAAGKQEKWYKIKVPVDTTQFKAEQVWFQSKDGTRVPMFLVHRPEVKLDGSNPVLLDGYGGFTLSQTPYFSADTVAWVEHGGIYADVNLRGGGEFGEAWHKAGMLAKKQNVFDDFIAAAEWLIANKYTTPEKLAITGGSNGGLLVGAVLTQRPELYRAVVCWHPLLDMLRYDQFMDGQFWVSEYGAAKDAEQFGWLYAYSPYHHVKAGLKYPSVLFLTGDGDTRVAPLHARKMTALMQQVATPERPAMLVYDLTAGHAGGRSVSQGIADSVDQLSFLFWQLGMEE
jgi:prolyl oligopeptidase